MWKPIILDVECIVCNKSLQKINHNPRSSTHNMGKVNNNRRLRTPNWSLDEKQYLLELIKQRKEVVITKSNNGPNYSEEKDIAWNEILRELSVKFGNKFSVSSTKKVKTQWQNMKRIAREEITTHGASLQKYTRQSLEVCNILELVKDGVLKTENENMNDTIIANIEIKTECIDDESSQPSCSTISNEPSFSCNNNEPIFINSMNTEVSQVSQNSTSMDTDNMQNQTNSTTIYESSSSSISEQEGNILEIPEESSGNICKMKNASAMTEPTFSDACFSINPFHREIQEYLKYTSTEKQLKVESLKEERHVIKAMRETAELNKIIAEQKLKHVLWVKKRDMANKLMNEFNFNLLSEFQYARDFVDFVSDKI